MKLINLIVTILSVIVENTHYLISGIPFEAFLRSNRCLDIFLVCIHIKIQNYKEIIENSRHKVLITKISFFHLETPCFAIKSHKYWLKNVCQKNILVCFIIVFIKLRIFCYEITFVRIFFN